MVTGVGCSPLPDSSLRPTMLSLLLVHFLSVAPPSPLDALDPKSIPVEERTADLPPETVAILGSNRGRHGNAAKCVAVSPDGKWIATGSRDETVRIWSPSNL